jgi:hypothetical protein
MLPAPPHPRNSLRVPYRLGAAVPLRMLSAVSAKSVPAAPRAGGPGRGRPVIAAAAAVLTAVAVCGCSKFDQAMGQQEEVVVFQPNVTNAVKLKVRDSCSHIQNVDVEPLPLPSDHKLSDHVYDVRYEVGSASEVELAEFQQCVAKFPSSVVQGIETDTPGGD